jgi:hypothetical protein
MLRNGCNIRHLALSWPAIGALIALAVLLCSVPAMSQRNRPPMKLTAKQQVEKANKMLTEMRNVLTNALDILKQAREQQDIQKLNGINEALSAIKGLLRLSEQNFVALQTAIANSDSRGAEHEFVKISIAYAKIRELDGRVRSLSRPSAGGTVDGRPIIERILDSDLPTEDPVEGLKDIQVNTDRPPSASPFF